MKKITAIIIALMLAIPAMSYALTGQINPIVQYGGINLDWFGYDDVIKFYDHDEGVVCYITRVDGGISCIKDN